MPKKKKNLGRWFHLDMRGKLNTAVFSIIAVLFLSSLISIIVFNKMSSYTSELIAKDIDSINLNTELTVKTDEYNLKMLSAVGRADSLIVSGIDPGLYINASDSLVAGLCRNRVYMADSLRRAYVRYVEASKMLDEVIQSDFVDTREWYFTSLLPKCNRMRYWQDVINNDINNNLHSNSENLDTGYYRGIVPVVVCVAAAVLMCLLLMFFINVYYVTPIRKMLKCLDEFIKYNHPYNIVFEGDDELQQLNSSIGDVISENIVMKHRIREREH